MENGETQEKKRNWIPILVVIIVILLIVLAGILAYYLLRDSPEPTPASETLVPGVTQAAPTLPPPTAAGESSAGQVVIQSYTVEPERILAGGCANISWLVENADLIQLVENGVIILDQAPANHTYQTCPPEPGVFVYRLNVSNSAGSANWMELQVIADPVEAQSGAANQTPAPPEAQSHEPLPQATGPVTINKFYVEPQRTNVGSCATLYWEIFNADQIQLLRDGVSVMQNPQLQDSFEDCYSAAAIYQYRLEAENSEGNNNVLELQVIVDP